MPALLARSPTANIKELGQERLQIMPCEPLHDLKGVLFNTLTVLERHLPAPAVDSYKEVIGVTVGHQHSRGCDWREAVCLLAKQATTWESCPQKAKHLLRNLADISSILYAGEEERKPKMVVRLALLVWRCFALIRELPETRQKHAPERPCTVATYMTSHMPLHSLQSSTYFRATQRRRREFKARLRQ